MHVCIYKFKNIFIYIIDISHCIEITTENSLEEEKNDTIENTIEYYVTWQKLESFGASPGKREMHGYAVHNGRLYITGGRDEEGNILQDVWMLEPSEAESSSTPLRWVALTHMNFTSPRCAHGCSVVSGGNLTSNDTPSSVLDYDYLCVYGGFQGSTDLSSDLSIYPIPRNHTVRNTPEEGKPQSWESIALTRSIEARFGLSMCIAPGWTWKLTRNEMKKDVFSQEDNQESNEGSVTVTANQHDDIGLLVFGGVNIDNDFSDLWLLAKSIT